MQQPDDQDTKRLDTTRVLGLPPAIDDDATVIKPPNSAGGRVDKPARVALVEGSANISLALARGYHLFEYRLDKVLGQGGFGITYLATDVNLNVPVAIKEYLPEQFACRLADATVTPRSDNEVDFYEKGLDSYLREARTLATFRHPNIVRVARFFEANSTAYMVLEYEHGESLKTWWGEHNRLGEQDLLGLILPLLDGVAVVHENGFLHRDIKPDNIYVRDADGYLVLLDFGSAGHTSVQHDEENSFVTPGYGPIEQYMPGEQGPWTDIYALGATLYWMVSGRKPVEAIDRMGPVDPLKPAVQVGQGRYSVAFLEAIDWALKPQTKHRPRDIAAFRQALCAAYPASLDLQDALRSGDAQGDDSQGWLTRLRSPNLPRKARLLGAARALVRPPSWPLGVKMTLAMVVATLLPMLLVANYNYNGTVQRVSAGELRNLEQLAGSVAGRVAQLISDSKSLAVYVSTDTDLVAYLKGPTEAAQQQILARLMTLVKANPDIDVATLLDVNGMALTSTNPTVPGGNFQFREYFQKARAGNSFITGLIVGATAGGSGAYFANPVRDESGAVIGVVTIRIRAGSVAAILEEARGQTPRSAMLVDADGVVLHHSDPRMQFKSLAPLAPERLSAIVADQRFRRSVIESVNLTELARALVGSRTQGNAGFVSPMSGKSEIVGYAPVSGHNWVVAMTESREYFEAPLRELFRNVLYSVVVVGAVFVLLAAWFARTIVRPIEALTAAAHALKSADYDKATVRVTSSDEVGQLARVFNVLIDVLRQRERELGTRPRRKAKQTNDVK